MADTRKRAERGTGLAGTIFSPAVAVMNRLRYVWKFALIGALMLIPFGVVTWLQVTKATSDATFNRKERYGVEHIAATRDFLQFVQRHRDASAAVASGDASQADAARLARDEADRRIAEVDRADAKHGEVLRTTSVWQAAKAEWSTIKQTSYRSAQDAQAAHDALTGHLVTDLILNTAGNNSNLILDPDLDSYWLMDVYVIKLPLLTETINKAAVIANAGLARGGLSPEEKITLAGLHQTAQSTMSDLVTVNMKTAYDYQDQNAKGGVVKTALDPEVRQSQEKVAQFLSFLRERVLLAATVMPAPAELRQRAADANNQLFSLWTRTGPQLDALVETRVNAYEKARLAALITALLGALLLLYLFTGFYRSVRDSLVGLGDATRRMIAGTSEEFHLASRDELGQMVDSYNDINKALVEARVLRQRVEAENQQLQGNILELLRVVSDAAEGKLSARARVSEGALGNVADAFNQMMESLQGLLAEIQRLVLRTNDVIAQIQASSGAMAQGATQQVNEIVQAIEAVRRMSDSIQRVSGSAETAASAARRAQESAQVGTSSVQNVVRGMASLRGSVQAGAKKIKSLGDRSMEITGIVGTIAKISDQTNMLALNAAIEAARAGEHGRGFSVVADQVRQLAERTAAATQEIESLVRVIQSETNESVEAIEQQTSVVEEESQIVGQAGDALNRIQEVSTHSAELIADISASAREQVDGAIHVSQVIEQVSRIARLTEEGAGESLRVTQELATLSAQLQKSVNQFQLN